MGDVTMDSGQWDERYNGDELVWTSTPNEFLVAEAVGLRKVNFRGRVQHVSLCIAHDFHDRARHCLGKLIRCVNHGELERIEHHERADRIYAEEVDERLHDNLVEPSLRVVTHLLKDSGRRIRSGLIRAPRRRSVVSVNDCDNSARHADRPFAHRLRIAAQVGSHVVLVCDSHRPVRNVFLLAAKLEQREHAKPRVRGDTQPFFF